MSLAKSAPPEGCKYRGCRQEMLKYLPEFGRRILDVGCAVGDFGLALKKMRPALEVWGIELSAEAAEQARAHLDQVWAGPIEELAGRMPAGYFDAIFFNDVLEHLVAPELVIRALRSALTPGGMMIASIPNVRHFRTLRQLIFEQDWRYQDTGVLDRTHLRFFTKKSMVRLFSEQELEIVQVEGINKSGSWRPLLYNLLFWGQWGADTLFQQYVVVARR